MSRLAKDVRSLALRKGYFRIITNPSTMIGGIRNPAFPGNTIGLFFICIAIPLT